MLLSRLLRDCKVTGRFKGSQLEPTEDGVKAKITIINTAQLPVPHVSCQLAFQPIAKSERDSNAEVSWSFVTATEKPMLGDEESSAGSFLNQKQDLPASCRHTETLMIKTDVPRQCNARFSLEFPSPRTGQPVRVDHAFGLYLIDQVIKLGNLIVLAVIIEIFVPPAIEKVLQRPARISKKRWTEEGIPC